MSFKPRPKIKLLLIAPYFDANVPGESWSTYKWVEGLSLWCDVTVLTTHSRGWDKSSSPTNAVEVVDWQDVSLPARFARINHEMAPGYIIFYHRARKWIKRRIRLGWDFDLVHQINPLALRYPSPAAALGIRYVIGPLAGSLSTPSGFAAEGTDKQWFRKLRQLDKLRLRIDPYLRRTYADAALVLGVAPYVEDLLAQSCLKRFAIISETGVDSVSNVPRAARTIEEPPRLLFVGRVIRTKGVIDAIRATALALKHHSLRFDIIGDGDHLDACREEVIRLGISDHVCFHGRLPRSELNQWYRSADVFLFPSFREPSGNVVFEALMHGMAVITCSVGGPGYVVDDTCGIRVVPTNPSEYAERLSDAVLEMATCPERLTKMSAAATARLEKIALWRIKIETMLGLYAEILRVC